MNARLQKGGSDRCMHMVRCDDRNRFDSVGPPGLGPRHGSEVRIGSIGPKADSRRRADCFVGRSGKRTGDKLVTIVEARGDAVDGADEGAFPAAYHS